MGGVDRTGATLRIVEGLAKINVDCIKKVVIGKGFAHTKKSQNYLS